MVAWCSFKRHKFGDYRVFPQVRDRAFLEDCAAATGWKMPHLDRFGVEPARLMLAGHSAGDVG